MKLIEYINGRINRPFDRVIHEVNGLAFQQRKIQIDQSLLYSTESGTTSEKYCDHEIIVSLTTYGRRIHSAYIAIESIMEQTMKANRIVLWLDHSFEGKRLPESLILLCKRGLEIAYCDDILSYKKLIPALHRFPNDAIITIDDDVIYEINALENLIVPYLANPNAVYCNRAHRMTKDKNGKLAHYLQWQIVSQKTGYDNRFFPTGVGGILYPPHSLDEEVFNEEVFMDISRLADDVWFKCMALKKGTTTCRVETHHANGCDFLDNDAVQDTSLTNVNVGKSMNDIQMNAVLERYDLYKVLGMIK